MELIGKANDDFLVRMTRNELANIIGHNFYSAIPSGSI